LATLPSIKRYAMNTLQGKKHFIGIDISKDTLDLSLLSEARYGAFKDHRVSNSFKGYDAVLVWLEKMGVKAEDCLLCMEHTGTYGLLLFAWLNQMGFDFCVEPGQRIKKSMGMVRGKSDRVDARRIADYACTNRSKLTLFTMPSTLIIQVKQLLTYREQLVKIGTSLKNSLASHEQYQAVSGLRGIANDIRQQIQENERRIDGIEEQIVATIGADAEMKRNFDMATSVKGVGLIIAAFMLVTTNNFTGFENGRKYACYSGIAPFENTSGSSIKGKAHVSHLGNKRVKALLSNGASSACTWDPEIKAYYNRKLKEGKEHMLIINAIRCKLVNRVFAAVKRQAPFVKLYEHNFD